MEAPKQAEEVSGSGTEGLVQEIAWVGMAKTSLVKDVTTVQGKMLQPSPAHFKTAPVAIGINDCNDCFGVRRMGKESGGSSLRLAGT